MIWSIQSQSHLFRDLAEKMQGSNYVPGIVAWSFDTDSEQLSLNDLLKINNEPLDNGSIKPLKGHIQPDAFQSAVETINEYLSYIYPEEPPK